MIQDVFIFYFEIFADDDTGDSTMAIEDRKVTHSDSV